MFLDHVPHAPPAVAAPSLQVEGYRDGLRLSLHSTLACAARRPERLGALAAIERVNGVDGMYESRHAERLHEEARLPFRIAAEPFALPPALAENLPLYGKALAGYYNACNALIDDLPADHVWSRRLNHHKPRFLLDMPRGKHLFIRPDFLLTEGEPVVTEIETSPFGLGLSHYLNDAYPGSTLDDSPALVRRFEGLGSVCFGYTPYTERYRGQFAYFAAYLRGHGIDADTAPMEQVRLNGAVRANGRAFDTLYRGFYLHEADEAMLHGNVMPNGNPQIEEKAVMGMLWDDELEPTLRASLGDDYDVLRRIIPPTFVVDGVPPRNFPAELRTWEDLAALPRSQRTFVLKTSGFSPSGSWGKGVTFLEKLSHAACAETLAEALRSEHELFVVQQFRKGAHFSQEYFDFHGADFRTMRGRVRFTPYFSTDDGALLTSKITMCENTDCVHAMVDSINSPVSHAHSGRV